MADDMDIDSDISDQLTPSVSVCSSCGSSTHPSQSKPAVHYSAFQDFRNRANEALHSAFPVHRRPRSTTASVLLLKWADDDLGVSRELSQLRDVFDQSYNFETEIWDIPSHNPDRELAYKVYDWRDRHCEKNPDQGQQLPLLILYYGGHAEESLRNSSVWRRQTTYNWCGVSVLHKRMIDELKGAAVENQLRGDSLSVVELHSYMHDNRKLQYQPIYAQVNRNRYHTISLIPFPILPQNDARDPSPHDSDSWSVVSDGRTRSFNSPTRVLLAIHTSRSPTGDLIGFLKNECMLPLYVTGMKIEDVVTIESIYESESTLALVSVPLPIWNLLPDHPACRYIGKIKSKSLCQQPSVQQLFTQIRDLAIASSSKEKPDDTLGSQRTQVLNQYLQNSMSNHAKNNGASNDGTQALETTKAAWPASVSSSQDGEAEGVENTVVLARAISEGISPTVKGEFYEPPLERQREYGAEILPTPPEPLFSDRSATNKWHGVGQPLHDGGNSENLFEVDRILALSQRGGDWLPMDNLTQRSLKLLWTTDVETQPERAITSGENTVSNSSLHPTPESVKDTAPPPSSRTGRLQGLLTKTKRQPRSCYRCFIMRERCVRDEQSTVDALCSRCRKISNTSRTWSLPCSAVELGQRTHFLLPNTLQSRFHVDDIAAFLKSEVRAFLPNSSIKLSLAIGFGSPLVLDAIEFVPNSPGASGMTTRRLKESGGLEVLELGNPPLLPLALDQQSFARHFNIWLDSALQDNQTDFLATCFPGAHEKWQREILAIIFQYQRSTISDLESSGAGPYHTLHQACKLVVLNHVMFHPFCVTDGEVGSLLGQMQSRQPESTEERLAPVLTNLVLKAMLFPTLKALTNRVLSGLQSILRSHADPAGLWDPTFSIIFLCLVVVGKTQVSLVEGELIWYNNGGISSPALQASNDVETMDKELSEHLIGMFHARFGTTRKASGDQKCFNPFGDIFRGRLDQMSSLKQSIGEIIISTSYLDLSDFRTTATSRDYVKKLLARFMKPFFG